MRLFLRLFIRFLQIVSLVLVLLYSYVIFGLEWTGWNGQNAGSSGQCGVHLDDHPSSEDIRGVRVCLMSSLGRQVGIPIIVEITFLFLLNRIVRRINIKKI